MSIPLAVTLRTLAGDILIELHDHSAGYEILQSIGMPEDKWSRAEETSIYMDGSAAANETLTRDSVTLRMRVTGSSWAQTEQRRMLARNAWLDVSAFLLCVTVDGVTHVYRAWRPDVTELQIQRADVLRGRREFLLTFPTQPHPVVTFGGP